MPNNNYTFKDADKLVSMGSSWFISYLYYTHIDSNHKNWEKVSHKSRISTFKSTEALHPLFINQIINMKKLGSMHMGISGNEVLKMAWDIKTKMNW